MANCNSCGHPMLSSKFISCKCSLIYHEKCALELKSVDGFYEKCCSSKADFSLLYQIERMLFNQSVIIKNSIISDIKISLSEELDKRFNVFKQDFDKKLSDNEMKILDNEKKILDNEDMIAELVERIDVSDKNIKELSPMKQEEMMAEMRDRSYREKNVLIFGVPDDKNVDDAKLILQIINSDIDTSKFSFSRLGKPKNNNIRPLKVNCYSSDQALLLLTTLRKLGRENKHNFKVTLDNTPMQRMHYKKLLETLKSYENKGDNSKQIKYIRGVPTIVQKN